MWYTLKPRLLHTCTRHTAHGHTRTDFFFGMYELETRFARINLYKPQQAWMKVVEASTNLHGSRTIFSGSFHKFWKLPQPLMKVVKSFHKLLPWKSWNIDDNLGFHYFHGSSNISIEAPTSFHRSKPWKLPCKR